VDENVETLTVEHQPRHDILKFRSGERKPELRNRVRAPRLVAQFPDLDAQGSGDLLPQPFGARAGLGVIMDMGVIAVDPDRLAGWLDRSYSHL
jgi:hypothetical protein